LSRFHLATPSKPADDVIMLTRSSRDKRRNPTAPAAPASPGNAPLVFFVSFTAQDIPVPAFDALACAHLFAEETERPCSP
jgi:hypothetical protein